MTSLTQIARRAYDRACEALEYKRDVTREISAVEALRQYRELTAAYQQEKEDLELAAFLSRAGLKPSKHFEKLDRTLLQIEREGNEIAPVPADLNTVTEKVCADICASISSNRAA
jgi:hypothetical protein